MSEEVTAAYGCLNTAVVLEEVRIELRTPRVTRVMVCRTNICRLLFNSFGWSRMSEQQLVHGLQALELWISSIDHVHISWRARLSYIGFGLPNTVVPLPEDRLGMVLEV